MVTHCLLSREYEALAKKVEETKEKYSELDKQDVKCREDMKHTSDRSAKLEKSLKQEKNKVSSSVVVETKAYKVFFWYW